MLVYCIWPPAEIALAHYDTAKNYLEEGLDAITKNYDKHNTIYIDLLKTLASLNKLLSIYDTSQQEYNEVVSLYGSKINNFPPAIAVIADEADLEARMVNLQSANQYADTAFSRASKCMDMQNIDASAMLENIAYVNYCCGIYKVADTLYRNIIKINSSTKQHKSASIASALNGLGLVEVAAGKYKQADSLFGKSIELHKDIYTESHPLTATVYINYGNLCIIENRVPEAEAMLNKALEIDKKFLKEGHDIFGDIYVALGDLFVKKGRKEDAMSYYQKALSIYTQKLGEKNPKTEMVRRKI